MRSTYINPSALGLVLAALTPENRLAVECMLQTGLRISDVLNIKTEQLYKQRFTVREMKTGKSKRVYLPNELWHKMQQNAGRLYVFEGRCDWRKHRQRQTVWRDLKRAQAIYTRGGMLPDGANISPHSARKVYAVEKYRASGGNIAEVGKALNHSPAHVATTLIYALSDKLTVDEAASLVR